MLMPCKQPVSAAGTYFVKAACGIIGYMLKHFCIKVNMNKTMKAGKDIAVFLTESKCFHVISYSWICLRPFAVERDINKMYVIKLYITSTAEKPGLKKILFCKV